MGRTWLHFHIQTLKSRNHVAHPKPVPRTAESTARGRPSPINPLSKSNQENRGYSRVLIVWLRCACEMCECVCRNSGGNGAPLHLLRWNRIRITSLSYSSSSASTLDDPSSREDYEILLESNPFCVW